MLSDIDLDAPFTWTEKLTKIKFGGERDEAGCRCKLCNEPFKPAELVQFILCNGMPDIMCPNFFAHMVCVHYAGDIKGAIQHANNSYTMAVTMAKWWNIYGPDWGHGA